MDNTATLWPSLVTQVVSHLIILACAFTITRDSIQVQSYSGWLCLLCIEAIGLLIFGDSKYFSALLDHMGCSQWEEPLWVMICNVGVFSCVHCIYLMTTTESQLASDTPPLDSSFPGPEELDRGDYTFTLLVKLEAHEARLENNRRREEDYRISAGELPPFLLAIGEGTEDGEGEDNGISDDEPPNGDFWDFFNAIDGPPMEHPRGDDSGDSGGSGDSDETVRPSSARPHVRPENLYRRPVSIPGFPLQALTQIGPATARPRTEQEGRDGRASSPEDQPSAGEDHPVSPNTARNFPLYTEHLRTRLVSPQLSITLLGDDGVL
ncbi:hypothetical protein B9Z19DRAFT_1091120 [Tuber borchii]|uniref:Uncharacterized protein n=1 Tax=Tuber borchii TaxID=42251 RepID=A0A2T6ZHW7_TUBBO|nr:hypothetical protein B9Z19DRAFT_1091120 [Tuber borchii]